VIGDQWNEPMTQPFDSPVTGHASRVTSSSGAKPTGEYRWQATADFPGDSGPDPSRVEPSPSRQQAALSSHSGSAAFSNVTANRLIWLQMVQLKTVVRPDLRQTKSQNSVGN